MARGESETKEPWQVFDGWNQAIVDTVFTDVNAGVPAYLHMEGDVLVAVAAAAGYDGEDPEGALCRVVRHTLDLRRWGYVFREHVKRVATWRKNARRRAPGQQLSAPPVLPLLAVLALAAERMGEDERFAGNAYYPRLHALLEIENEALQQRVVDEYRACAEDVWGALNQWLELLDGALGTPTAYSLSFRYIGLPMSQALVRAVDRRRLPDLFGAYGLSPGMQMSPSDMVRLLEAWLASESSTVTSAFRRAYANPRAKERIAEVVALELLAWDGARIEDSAHSVGGGVRLVAGLRTFPVATLELGLNAHFTGVQGPAAARVTSATGDAPPLEFEAGASGWLTARRLTGVDLASLLSGVLVLEEDETKTTATRRPRALITLRKDEFLGTFAEVERVQLGEDFLLLVKDDRALADKVEVALTQVARPGYRRLDDLRGLPRGWVLYKNVQVMAVTAQDLGQALNPLVPIMTSQLVLADGLKLPGRIRKFSSLLPPEVRAVTQNADTVRVRVEWQDDLDQAQHLEWRSDTAALVIPLTGAGLLDGDYTVQLFEGDAKVPRQQTMLRLRSSDTVDAFASERAPQLAYDLEKSGWAPLSAGGFDDGVTEFVDGPLTVGEGDALRWAVSPEVWWTAPKSSSPAFEPTTVVATPDPRSCIVTGAHFLEFPVFYGKARGQTIDGVCKYCGLVKRLPAWAPSRKRSAGARVPSISLDVNQLEAVQQEKPHWLPVMDGLIHVGGGPIGLLERLALQMEGSSLFVDEFIRGLEALGHVQVRRGQDLQPVEFEYSGNYLAGLPSGEFLLVGSWATAHVHALKREIESTGGCLRETRAPAGPSRLVVEGLDEPELSAAVKAAHEGAVVVPDAARNMLPLIDTLSTIRSALPVVFQPAAKRSERFDLASSAWSACQGVTSPGAYRLQASFLTTYVHVDAQELADGTARRATAQLSKHLAAHAARRPLVAYDAVQQQLLVPLGAELPGLLGRVAVLCSGRLPLTDTRRRVVVYPDVPQDIAEGLAALLVS